MSKQLLLGVAALCLVLGACGGDDENTPENEGCTTEADCPDGHFCDTDGVCKPDVEPEPCDGACSGATPICDEATDTCKTCTATEGCSGAAAICDTAANGGVGACVACLGTSDCTEPSVCDPATHTCVGCTDTEGCSGDAPICDDGTCVACTATEGCGTDEVCDLSVTGGACVTCTATAGCNDGEICDLSVTGGACVVCTATAGCATNQVCDLSVPGGECVECTTDDDCDGQEICDAARNACVTCNDSNDGCSNPYPYCDVAANGGEGECVGCLLDENCTSPDYPVCHPERQSCAVCATDEQCGGDTPHCNPTFPGKCVECLESAHCLDSEAPVCNSQGVCSVCTAFEGCGAGTFCDTTVPGGACLVCANLPNGMIRGCTGDELCDAAANEGAGACVTCLADNTGCDAGLVCDVTADACVTCRADGAGCTGDLLCDTSVAGGACVTCLPSGAGCAADESCVEGACGLTASLQIQAVRDAAASTALNLPVTNVTVTYLRGVGDPAGFFVQAEPTGPAMLVMVDPTTLTPAPAIGDRVSFVVTGKEIYGSATEATAITGWTVTSSGFDVTTFIQDLDTATDLVSALDSYEAELISLSGTIASSWSGAGGQMVSAQITTATVTTPSNDLKLRMHPTVRDALDLTNGCSFTIAAGPMWRFNTGAQPMAYFASDLTGIDCPGPTLVSAAAPANDRLILTFDRVLDVSSVLANGSQFTFSNGLTASAATASGKTVTLTTSSQTGGTVYTVTVAPTVLGLHSSAVVPPATPVTFNGYAAPVGALVINEIDYDQPGTDTAEFIEVFNGTASPVTLDDLDLVLVNGSAPGSIYNTIALGTGTLPAGGYLVAGLAAVTVPTGAIKVNFPSGASLQNGDPDAVVLFNRTTATVIDALSYGGANPVPNVAIPAGGTPYSFAADHVPLKDPGTTGLPPHSMSRNPNGTDTNTSLDWVLTTTVTPGAANVFTAP